MSVHNSGHQSPINSDHDDEIHDPDPVTRISKLYISDQLPLHPNDTTALTVVSIKLKGTENYQVWSCAMLLALEGKNKIGFIDGSCKRSNTNEVLGKQWDKVNAIVLGWILNSISEKLFLGQIFSKRAKHVWEELKETYDKVDGSIMFGLHNQINTLKQNCSSIADYYHKLNALWKQYDAMIELPKCVYNASEGFKKHNQLLKLMQFLMGLDDSYMKIRSSILSREVLPDVRSAYVTISSEESHRVAVGSLAGSSQRNQASTFVSNVPNSKKFQRSNQNFSIGPSRPNNFNNNRQGGGSGLNNNRQGGGSGVVCENCGFNGHTIDKCFKIIGYPADFGKKKSGQNFKKQSVSNNNSAGKSSSSGFTDEQMATLISLIKDNKVEKMCRPIWQHMTYTDKELDNVLDISHLRIKVGHPNRTDAYISKIGNLRLSNGLTLYDVMVIPEYYVTLISVHKLVKENKVIVAFDENRCYFLNQDLNLKNHDWHYRLGHPADPVLNVLKDTLQIDKKDNVVCCEICQRAKQTIESFPLSDHTSKRLGNLVHLDLWGPYKIKGRVPLHLSSNAGDSNGTYHRDEKKPYNLGVLNVGNQNGLNVVSEIANQHGDRNVVTASAEGNGNGINGNTIRCYNCQGEDHYASNCTVKPRKLDVAYLQKQMQIAQKEEAGIQLTLEEFDFMAAVGAYKETKRANANCTLENNLQQASSSGTQSDKAPVYDSDGSAEKTANCLRTLNLLAKEADESLAKAQGIGIGN
ncbi:ribonuclease H-like domain-containing protein [Tanacetum coccineum]